MSASTFTPCLYADVEQRFIDKKNLIDRRGGMCWS